LTKSTSKRARLNLNASESKKEVSVQKSPKKEQQLGAEGERTYQQNKGKLIKNL